jgi:hypothetical protein
MNDHYINQPVGQKELEALRMIAKEEEIDFFRRNAHLIGALTVID